MPIKDDPEIAVSAFGDSLEPSAPISDPRVPLTSPSTPSAPPATAVAVAVAVPSASTTAAAESTTASRTYSPDGSLELRFTATTTRQDRYREVRIEHYHIPSDEAATEIMSLDITPGSRPNTSYLTKVEQHILPPDMGAVVTSPAPPSGPMGPGASQPGMRAYPTSTECTLCSTFSCSPRRCWSLFVLGFGLCVFIYIVIRIFNADF